MPSSIAVVLLSAWMTVASYSASVPIYNVARLIRVSPESYRNFTAYEGPQVTIETRRVLHGDSPVSIVEVSNDDTGFKQNMIVSVAGGATIFCPAYRLSGADRQSLTEVSSYAMYRSFTYVGQLKITVTSSDEFVFASEFSHAIESDFITKMNKYVGILDMGINSDFIKAVGGRFILSTTSDTLTIRIGEQNVNGFIFVPIVEMYNGFVVRGSINEALLVDVILDSTSEHNFMITRNMLGFFTEKVPIISLRFCGYTFSFRQYAVSEDTVTKDLIVILNPASLRNVDMMFDALHGGRIGLRKSWPSLPVPS